MISTSTLSGWDTLTLANELIAVTVLPTRGAELQAFVHRPTGIDVLFKAPWGLAPAGAPPRAGSDGHAFLERYAGGWQELFPSCSDACDYRGRVVPFHGEVAARAWAVEQLSDEALRLTVDCETVPLRLRRTMRLEPGSGSLVLDECVTNRSPEPQQFVWGHHCVLGPPLVAAGARFEAAASTIVTLPTPWEDTARLEPGQNAAWPHARARDGSAIDLGEVGGPDTASHDDVYLTDLDAGRAIVRNSELGLAFQLDWDPAVFRWIIAWQPYGGARAMPLAGSYALGVEPWVARGSLADAIAEHAAIALGPGASLETTLTASLTAEGAA